MVNLDDFKYGGTNVTAFRLLDPEREEVKQVVQDWIFGKIHKYFFVMIIYLLLLGIFYNYKNYITEFFFQVN